MSGDSHAAALLSELLEIHTDLVIYGVGGPKLQSVSKNNTRDWVENAAVMGIVEVLKHYSWFKEQFNTMLEEITEVRPDLLLLVDYPGFNLRFSKAVRAALPKTKQIYYISPQVWAWNKRRIPKMVAQLDEMLCLFPFEKPLLESAGLKTTHVGHPLVDEQPAPEKLHQIRRADLIGLFPGSREREVSLLFPVMIETARLIRAQFPNLKFEVPAATPQLQNIIKNLLAESNASNLISVTLGNSQNLMQKATCAVIASGTATLEAAVFGLPYCLVYKMAPTTYFLGKLLVKLKYIGIVNILADEKIVEELIQADANPAQIKAWIEKFLGDPAYRNTLATKLSETAASLGAPGTSQKAAQRLSSYLT